MLLPSPVAKSALLIDCYFNETSWYQLRKDIFIRYDWADSHVESIWCKTRNTSSPQIAFQIFPLKSENYQRTCDKKMKNGIKKQG